MLATFSLLTALWQTHCITRRNCRVSVSASGVGDDSKPVRERGRKIVEDMRIIIKAVNQNERRKRSAPVQIVETDAVRGDEGAFVGGTVS